MKEKNYDFRNDTGTWQTGRTQPPKRYGGLVAFLLVLVILLSGISTALSIMNLKLYRRLSFAEQTAPVAFSRSSEAPQPMQTDHAEIQELQSHLGISGMMIPEVYQRFYKLPRGIYVSRVNDRSEAKEKGLVVGDIITRINDTAIRDELLPELLSTKLQQGDTVTLTLYRSGTEQELLLTWSNFD